MTTDNSQKACEVREGAMKTKGYRLSQTITELYEVEHGGNVSLPLFLSGVSAGFPSPADDYIDRRLDLNELLIRHPAATFFVRVAGDSMTGVGINHDDLLIVDRSLEAGHGKIVIAAVDGELTVKRLFKGANECRLLAENPDYPPIVMAESMALEIWGVVTSVIHQF